jgi:hypothetical protein
MQFNLFREIPHDRVGLVVRLPSTCRCGATTATIGKGAGPHAASLRSLRRFLKIAGRHFGLRATNLRETTNTTPPWRSAEWRTLSSARGVTKMDMSEFAGSRFLKVQDVKGGPLRAKIVRVDLGKYNKPNIHLDDGSILSANATNVRTLCRAYGADSDRWIAKEIELTLGTIEYQGEDQEAIVVKPISPPEPKDEGAAKSAKAGKTKSSKSSEMDDEIAF